MSRIKGKDTKLELLLRKKLWGQGVRYRKNYTKLNGKPDIAFLRQKVLVFIDSCFWHGCPWHGKKPTSNIIFWTQKIRRNKERDNEVNKDLRKKGFIVMRFWEHQLYSKEIDSIARKIIDTLSQNSDKMKYGRSGR